MRPPFRPNNAPAQAKAVGYIRQTFDSKMPAKQIDLAATKAEGFEWYLWSFFGDQVPNAAQFVNPSKVDYQGRRLVGLDIRVIPSTGNDELRLVAL